MRIGIVTGEYPPMQGGVGMFSYILAQTFCTQGHSVAIFSSQHTRMTDDIPLANTVNSWNFASLRAISRWADAQKLDVINLQFQTAAFQMSPWIHFLPQVTGKIPVVTTFHDLRFPYLFPKAGFLRDWIVMHLAKSSAGVIVTNHEDFTRVKSLPNSTLIPIGSNILTATSPDFQRDAWRASAGASANEVLLAHFGFINRSKGIETLLDNMAKLRREGVPVKLVMIGGRTGSSDPTNAAYADEIDRKIEALDLKAHIFWTGFINDEFVSDYLHAADMVMLPFLDGASYRRGSLMAAIHHDCAIVTTTPQVEIPSFQDGKNMRLVPPGNSQALSNAIRQLIEQPSQRASLQKGASELKHQFDWSAIARDTAAFFQRIVEERR
jgi:glycosyltransferase involved in cell wall biosynthesis